MCFVAAAAAKLESKPEMFSKLNGKMILIF